MTWKAKAQPTKGEVAIAYSLLPPSVSWKIGVILTDGHIQYRGAKHPNATGEGTHPGVEVWTDIPADQYGATPMAEDLGTTSEAERKLVLDAAEAQGYPRDEVSAAIQIESAWKPHNWYHGVAPEKAAGGLIGFMPFVLKALGWTKGAVAFRAQSSAEQAPWVGAYFAQVKGQWKHPGDTYVALAASSYVGKPDDRAVYKAGTPSYDLNKVWDTDKDGIITVGNLREVLLRFMKKGGGSTPLPKVPEEEEEDGQLLPSRYYLVLSALPSPASVGDTSLGEVRPASCTPVRLIQAFLAMRGLYLGKIDGNHGPLTETAIRKFLP